MRTLVALAITLAALASGCGSTVTARHTDSAPKAGGSRQAAAPVHVAPYRKPVPGRASGLAASIRSLGG